MDSIYRKDALKGKYALVTGGASGIGLEISKQLVNHGAKLAIFGRSQARLDSVRPQFPEGTCFTFQCDVRHPEQVSASVKAVASIFPRIDILVNSAAGNFLAPFDKLSAKGFRTVIEIDTLGTFNTIKSVYETSMKANGGVVVNISSTLQMPAVHMQSHAAAAKSAIDSLTKSLALELGPQKIRVNGIAPGAIVGTEGMERLTPKGKSDVKFDTASYIPAQRLGTSKDISEGVLYLVLADYVTGHTLVVDGGLVLSFPNFTLMHPDVFNSWRAKL